jgi:2,5-diamino-6-(ribosylamino)-4(3H)-pyrimidinone 5'-phosphate reductase
MLPKVIVFNSISVDGSIKEFQVDVALHYEVLAKMGIDCLLVGSTTAKSGIETFVATIPPEEEGDFHPPKNPDKDAVWWVIPDSRGSMLGLLHVHRKSGYAKDIILLVSKSTPKSYLDYLAERHYDYIVAGDDHVDYKTALEKLNTRYGIKTVVTDSGGILASALIERGLVDEVQLLVAPEIVGQKTVPLFRRVVKPVKLELERVETVKGHLLLVYKLKSGREV